MMLTDIEEKIVERLNAKLTDVSRIAIDEAHSLQALKMPSVDVVVAGGPFIRVGQQIKLKPQVFVIVTFQNLRSAADRRKGVYPILEAIVALLVDNKLGLKIDALLPKRLDNITEESEAQAGKIVIQMEFETGFIIDKQDDEVITDLLRIGLNYYLQDPVDDEVADATDLVTLNQT